MFNTFYILLDFRLYEAAFSTLVVFSHQIEVVSSSLPDKDHQVWGGALLETCEVTLNQLVSPSVWQ